MLNFLRIIADCALRTDLQMLFSVLTITCIDFFMQIIKKTTLAALKCKDGIIVAADSRTSAGIMISNDFTDKIQQISKCIVSMQCGSAASSQKLVDIARQEAMLYE